MYLRNAESLPSSSLIVDTIAQYTPLDDFSHKILALDDALIPYEKTNQITGWRTRVLLYELARRRIPGDVIKYWSTFPDDLQTSETILSQLQGWRKVPARILSWEEMENDIHKKSVIATNGKFRSIPTIAQLEYVWKGFVRIGRADRHVLFYEPSTNIRSLSFPSKPITFPDRLRSMFWSHVPTIDIITKNRSFTTSHPSEYWRKTHQRLTKIAAWYVSTNDPESSIAFDRHRAAGGAKDEFPLQVEHHGDYRDWSTSEWDLTSTGTKKFVEIAIKYLITGQG
jgi:hypothetical protein